MSHPFYFIPLVVKITTEGEKVVRSFAWRTSKTDAVCAIGGFLETPEGKKLYPESKGFRPSVQKVPAHLRDITTNVIEGL